MKKILSVVLTKKYLSRAILIIMVFGFLTWLSRTSLIRASYMVVFCCWCLTFLYMKINDSENDL